MTVLLYKLAATQPLLLLLRLQDENFGWIMTRRMRLIAVSSDATLSGASNSAEVSAAPLGAGSTDAISKGLPIVLW